MADSPEQPQLKTQKWIHYECELKQTYPINRKNIGVTRNKHTPHYWVCLLGALRGMIRGYASGSVEG